MIVDIIAIIAIPAQIYTYVGIEGHYVRIHCEDILDTNVVWINYIILGITLFQIDSSFITIFQGIIKGIAHLLVYLILRMRISDHNELSKEKVPSYGSLYARNIKENGAYFTLMSFVSTRDAYIAASILLTGRR